MFSFLLFHGLLLLWLPVLMIRHRAQVVYARGLFHSFLVNALCRLMGVVYVAEINSIVDMELAQRGASRLVVGLVRFFDRWNLKHASAFICVSQRLSDHLARLGADPRRLHVVHNGAAADVFLPGDPAEARRDLGLPEHAVAIGFTGVLAAWQGLDLLIEAAVQLPEADPPWLILIVGDGEMRDQLLETIAQRRLADRVRLVPSQRHERIARWVQALDMMVIPIYSPLRLDYGFSPLKFWEALSAGIPVLVGDRTECGPILKELDWPAAFATGDPADLARTIQDVTARLPEVRQRRGEMHAIIRRRHSWSAVAEQVEGVLAALCGQC